MISRPTRAIFTNRVWPYPVSKRLATEPTSAMASNVPGYQHQGDGDPGHGREAVHKSDGADQHAFLAIAAPGALVRRGRGPFQHGRRGPTRNRAPGGSDLGE